ncbi:MULTISPECIES: hypothetical protein [Propionispira]|uniref:hypothetical protein n=1 Tax=Propionispira TaxID=84034 RepID=UPI0003657B2E|nr:MULTISPECIES: hypothetical protein [Propionispira]
MSTGTLATFVIGLIVAGCFGFGLWKMYRSFFKGESECCGSSGDGCSSCCQCSSKTQSTDAKLIVK